MTQRLVVLPKGINVGTRNRVSMPALKAKLTEAGYTEVVTVLQSGNVLLTSPKDPAEVSREVERMLHAEFEVPATCLIRTGDQLRAVIECDPLQKVATDPARYLVNFLTDKPDPDAVRLLLAQDHSPEKIRVEGAEAYVWSPAGFSASKLTYSNLERRFGVVATARNWNTIQRIAAKL